MLKDLIYEDFQNTVSDLLICHRSILDVLAKYQESNARMNRYLTKAVTSCGCIKINACKKEIPPNATLADLKNILDSHLDGKLCQKCRENLETEIGRTLFYLAALCNLLDLSIYDVLIKEQNQLRMLGIFNLA